MDSGYADLTLARGIRAAAARWPDKQAIVVSDAALSYRQLARRISQAGNAVTALGAGPGDRVALIAPNRIEYHEVVAGLAEAGVTVVTLSHRLAAAELGAIFSDCAPVAVVADPNCLAAREAAEAAGLRCILFGPAWEALLARASDRNVALARETDSFALAYTSGTTGTPKGVMLSHRSRALTFLAMAGEYGCFGHDDRFLAVTPMAHGAGFVFGSAPLFFGGTVVLDSTGDPEAILRRIADDRVTGVFMVPTHLNRFAALPPAAFGPARGLRAIISNAAALSQSLKEMAVERFGDGLLHETYGSTEAGIVTNIRPDEILARPGSVGTPFPLIEIELRDAAGVPVAAREVGELFVRGPYAFNGYWNRPDATALAVHDGWVTVGDLATRDGDGFITISDRKNDMVVTGGMNVYPAEIERIIAGVPGVRETAVVGLPDPEWGERIHAFIVAGDPPPSAGAIIAACRAQLAAYKSPQGVSFIAELPRNASGKIVKRALREQARETLHDAA